VKRKRLPACVCQVSNPPHRMETQVLLDEIKDIVLCAVRVVEDLVSQRATEGIETVRDALRAGPCRGSLAA